jgi:salicylate hydroxylase
LEGKTDPLVSAHRTAWRALIPEAGVPRLFHAPETNLWLAPKNHLVHYPLRGGGMVNVVAIVEAPKAGAGQDDAGWNAPGDPQVINRHFAGWTPEVRALIAAAPDWRVWPLHDRRPLMRWSKGSITLLGDAAHPMLPFLAQGASQAIEDAAALASVLGDDVSDLPSALHRYAAIRARRAATVQNQSRRQGRIYHLSGLAAVARDLAIRTLGPDGLMARYDWVYGHKA